MATIVLTGSQKGKTRVVGRMYQFTEGKMDVENDNDAQKIFSYLKKYYPVSMAGAAEEKAPEAKPEVPSVPQTPPAKK